MGFLQLPSSQIHAALYVATEFSLPDPSLVSTLRYQPRCQNRSISARRGQRPKFRALALETGSGQSGTQNAVVFTQMPSVIWTSLEMAGSAAGSDRQASWRTRSLSASPCTLLEYSPHHREQDGSTAQQVNQKQRILPQAILSRPLLGGLYDDVSHVCQGLQDARSC